MPTLENEKTQSPKLFWGIILKCIFVEYLAFASFKLYVFFPHPWKSSLKLILFSFPLYTAFCISTLICISTMSVLLRFPPGRSQWKAARLTRLTLLSSPFSSSSVDLHLISMQVQCRYMTMMEVDLQECPSCECQSFESRTVQFFYRLHDQILAKDFSINALFSWKYGWAFKGAWYPVNIFI